MKTFTKYNIYHFYTGITLLCILQGCTEDKIVYKSIKDLSEEPAYLEIEKFKDTLITTKILFEGNVDEFNTVDSTTLLEAERYVMVYVLSYYYDTQYAKYYSKTAGTLSPVGSALSLFTGTYNFYAVCINEKNVAVPNFIDGVYNSITLNTDYLWCELFNKTPGYPSENYSIDFKHCCTQVILELNIDRNVVIEDFSYISLTPCSLDTIRWNLYSGDIGPATYLDETPQTLSYTVQNDTTYYAQLTMPPVRVASTTNMTATFQIKFENDTAPITFNAALPIYENYLMAGYSYKYDMMLKMDTILFDDVYIVDWVNVNVDNTPIIPSGEN